MAILNFEPYFESTNNKYYNPKYIITILENTLEKTLEDIKKKLMIHVLLFFKNK